MESQTYQLAMRSGPTPGKVYFLIKQENYIGRDFNNDIVINDSEVSRKHARIVMQPAGYTLEDLGSTNGTFVSGQRLMGPHLLKPGELIMLGENVSLVFEISTEEGVPLTSSEPMPGYAKAPAPVSPRETYAPHQPQAYPPPYTGQVPQGPPEPYYVEPQPRGPNRERRGSRTLFWAGCGCLLVLLCLIVAGVAAFDYMNLYCQPPFNELLSFLYTCP